jgi:hypothetical protein
MNGPISAEEQDNIRLIRSGGQPNPPLDGQVILKRPEVFWRTSQPEDGGRAHVRG